ncbi:hypothetical protein O181_000814 [Austropuccinia psidii MF-1]|uniref:Uncharacterized protein n=1 Tax=Austropuccinia psidii MF-1 TaxID=1389203 RepID=A0A9Q3B9B0_9BASI|nr:hypothetical protein [Austropuccinia psidii MF-1]
MESAKQDLSFRNEFAPQHFLDKIEKIPMPHSQDNEESNSNGEYHEQNTHVTLNSNIIFLIFYFLMWLYLSCGLSRENCHKAREMLIHIILHFTHEGLPNDTLLSNVPHDICTISKLLKLEFPFEQHVCCPHCYSLYYIEDAPEYCTYKPTNSRKPCDTELFNKFKVYPLPHIQLSPKNPTLTNQGQKLGEIRLKGQKPHHIPQAIFFSQLVLEWIKWFLNIPGKEQGIEDWAYEISTHQSIAVCDVAQGSVWKDIFCHHQPIILLS